jgi:alpha-tubulin suppressor-like RCC1 family protein
MDIENVLREHTTIDRIGIVFSHTDIFLGETFYSESNTAFFIETIRKYQVKNIDFLACDTLRNPVWKEFYLKLHAETGVIVGASDNPTGNIKYGGDWILESTSEDIERIYFINTIQYYTYLLGIYYHTMVLRTDGIWGTGLNNLGQLGNDTTTSRNTFQNISLLQSTLFRSNTVKLISCSAVQTFVVMENNTVWATGESYGNLFSQISFQATGTILSIVCGFRHTIILTSNNELWGRGDGTNGRLGEATSQFTSEFIKLVGITGTIKTVSCGYTHTAVLTTSNILWVTGSNGGVLGLGDTTDRTSFTSIYISAIAGINGRIAEFVSCGNAHTVLSMTDGTLWGCGSKKAIGINESNGYQLEFKKADEVQSTYNNGIRRIKMLCAGFSYTLVLMTDGTLWQTGGFRYGTSPPVYNYYTQVITPTTIFSMVYGLNFIILLGSNNILYGYGSNGGGALGQGTTSIIDSFTSILTDVLLLPNNEQNFSKLPLSQNVSNVSSVICFPAGTLVTSDQGKIPIQELKLGQHTLRGKTILAVTETYNLDKEMVCIEKDALRKNCPHRQTFISTRHKIYYKGKMKAAYRFVGHQKGFSYVPYQGEKLYNVLLEEYGTMNVHGMICETLHPANPVAIYYMKKLKQCLQ